MYSSSEICVTEVSIDYVSESVIFSAETLKLDLGQHTARIRVTLEEVVNSINDFSYGTLSRPVV